MNRKGNRGNASYIAEVVLYSRTLDDCEFHDVYKYLLDKYGITGEAIPEGASMLNSIYQESLNMNGGVTGTAESDYIRVDGSADANIGTINASGGNDIVYIKGWGKAKNSSVDGGGGNDTLIIDSSIYNGKSINKVRFTTGGDITYNNFSKIVSSSDFPFETTDLEEPGGCEDECPSGNTAPVGVPAPVSFSSRSLGSDTLLFQGQFDFDDWSGDLVAYELEDDGSLGDQKWSAAEMLESKDLSATTDWTSYNDHDIATSKSQKFEWSELETAQQDDINASEHLDYLRGDDSNEKPDGKQFRQRSSRLGDVFRSRPVYVGVPNLAWPDTGVFDYGEATRYSDFSRTKQNRTPMVYVGANDGALHGYRVDNGTEVLRYFPGNLYDDRDKAGYHFLTDDDYDHLSYVDGTPVVSDVFMKTTRTGEERWRTVLVGTQGGGGEGLFALDITDPETFNASDTTAKDVVLWEFTKDTYENLGYTYSRPTIALLNDERWAAITGNGDAPGLDDPTLLILYLEGGIDEDSNWTGDSGDVDYIEIPTDFGSGGLSSPTVIDTDGDGDGDRAYAGDTEGNLWVFDLSSEDPDDWEVANGGDPLFENTRDDPQPITVKPTVVRHPTVPYDGASNAPNVMVLFGTGRLNTEDDKSDTAVQAFYGIWDRGDTNLTHSLNLVAQEFVFEDENTRITNPSLKVNYKGSEYGWYIDLPADTGERIVSDAVVRGDMIFFNTVIPNDDPCAYGGTGWEMSVRIKNGGSPMSPVVDQNDDDLVNDEDTLEVSLTGGSETIGYSGRKIDDDEGLPGGPAIIGDKLFTRGSKKDEQPKNGTALAPVTDSGPVGRLSWEQLFPSL